MGLRDDRLGDKRTRNGQGPVWRSAANGSGDGLRSVGCHGRGRGREVGEGGVNRYPFGGDLLAEVRGPDLQGMESPFARCLVGFGVVFFFKQKTAYEIQV